MSDVAPTPEPAPVDVPRSDWALAGLYVLATLGLFLLVPGGHPLLLWPAVGAMAIYLLQGVIRLPLADGYASVVQPAFVVLLFAVPLNLAAILVPLGLFASTIVSGRTVDLRRLLLALADAWYCIPPIIILALFAPGRFLWHHWALYLAVLLAELTVSFLAPILRLAIYRKRFGIDPTVLVLPAVMDVVLTPFGAAAAHAGTAAAGECLLILASVLALVALLGHERTERLDFEAKALRDSLTGLANRALFDELLDRASHRLGRSGEVGGLLFIDLDNFKQVNDVHGHLAGDVVLRTVATRIEAMVRSADTVARFGGDEFAVLLAEPTSLEVLKRVAGAIKYTVSVPISLGGDVSVTVGASIGMALLGSQAEPADAVAQADEAMYEQKQLAHGQLAYR